MTFQYRVCIVMALAAGLWMDSTAVVFGAAVPPARAAHGMVVAEERLGAEVGAKVLSSGGNAVDAAVATAFALAVTHPTAGNIGGGGFLVYRAADGRAVAYDFREMAPAAAHPDMWLIDGKYDPELHHQSYRSVGVPGSVAGLHLAWRNHGSRPWPELLAPAIALARDGFVVSDGLSRSLAGELPRMKVHAATLAQFTRDGQPYQRGETLRQPDLARTLQRLAEVGPGDFYSGETARLIANSMRQHAGLITLEDLRSYRAIQREPVRGAYRGYEIISMPPPSSGGVTLLQMLNVLEGFDLAADGFGSAVNLHRYAETMRRAYADRAKYLGDPDRNPDMPIELLTSKAYAARQRDSIDPRRASVSVAETMSWKGESPHTTHLSVVDSQRAAVALTTTLEFPYGAAIVVEGAGFLLNNEMGDFNAVPGLTDATGRIGTAPNLARPGARMLSSMTPTVVAREGRLVMVTGSPGGRTIINTVLQTLVNVLDFGMNAQEAVDAGRVHHQWLPDRLQVERWSFSPDTLRLLGDLGHAWELIDAQGAAQVICVDASTGELTGGTDRRVPDGAAAGH